MSTSVLGLEVLVLSIIILQTLSSIWSLLLYLALRSFVLLASETISMFASEYTWTDTPTQYACIQCLQVLARQTHGPLTTCGLIPVAGTKISIHTHAHRIENPFVQEDS